MPGKEHFHFILSWAMCQVPFAHDQLAPFCTQGTIAGVERLLRGAFQKRVLGVWGPKRVGLGTATPVGCVPLQSCGTLALGSSPGGVLTEQS